MDGDALMSNIPKARALIEEALQLMARKKPKFIAPKKIRPLTKEEIVRARVMRGCGTALNDIAKELGTNIGRISEAVNG